MWLFKVDFNGLETDDFKVESDGLLSWNTGVKLLRSKLQLSFILFHRVLLKIAKIKCCMKKMNRFCPSPSVRLVHVGSELVYSRENLLQDKMVYK